MRLVREQLHTASTPRTREAEAAAAKLRGQKREARARLGTTGG